jgi:hypothetical protein
MFVDTPPFTVLMTTVSFSDSVYAEVRAAVSNTDDPGMPTNTLRSVRAASWSPDEERRGLSRLLAAADFCSLFYLSLSLLQLRVWLLGIAGATVLSAVNQVRCTTVELRDRPLPLKTFRSSPTQFFYFRYPSVNVASLVIQ